MYIYKTLFVLLLLSFDVSLAFTYMSKNNNRINNNISYFHKRGSVQQSNRTPLLDPYLNLHELSKSSNLLPIFPIKHIMTTVLSIGEPLNTFDDDMNIMKLLYLKLDNDANYRNNSSTVSRKIRSKIDVIVDNIMKNCKKNGISAPEASVSNLQKYCSPTNIIKNKNTRALVFCFKRCKYSLLLDNFSNYETTGYTRNIDTSGNPYYCVDIKVFAPYKTMLRNRIQFNDMYYPKIRETNNICYVIYKLSFKDFKDGNLYIEGHTLVPPRMQI